MPEAHEAVDRAIDELTKARKLVSKGKTKQVTTTDEIDYLKSLAYSWFRSHRPRIQGYHAALGLASVDGPYRRILEATGRYSARQTYVDALRDGRSALVAVRSDVVTLGPSGEGGSETPPDFAPLASDEHMRAILTGRWHECQKCLRSGAHLAATVMMGGLLEALFVARANQMKDKGPLFKAKTTPIDSKTKKPLDLRDWTLRPYIDVGHELGWITRSGKDVAEVLRDYRNYVHPEKERSHGIALSGHDSAMFWQITKSLSLQLLSGAAI